MFREARAVFTNRNFERQLRNCMMRWPKYILTWPNWFKGHTNEYKWWGWIAKNNWTLENPMICKIKVAVIIMQVFVTIKIKDMNSSIRSSKTEAAGTAFRQREPCWVSNCLGASGKSLRSSGCKWCCLGKDHGTWNSTNLRGSKSCIWPDGSTAWTSESLKCYLIFSQVWRVLEIYLPQLLASY